MSPPSFEQSRVPQIFSQEDRDYLLGSINAKVDMLLEHREHQETRLAALEKQLWWGKGALGVAILSFIPSLRDMLFHLGIH